MASLLDRTGMTIASTGVTSPLTLGSALGAVAPNLCTFMDFVTAGAVDGKTYRYLILDSNGNWEIGKGVYSSAGSTLTRSVQFSSNSNAAINLTASAQIFVSPLAEDVVSISDDQTALFSQTEKARARVNVGAAPIEALAANVLNLNAGMEVSQENGTTAVTLTAIASLLTKYIVDGVMAHYRGTFVATAQQVTDAPPGYKNSVKFTIGTAQASIGVSDELSAVIPIEGVRCVKLGFGAGSANALAVFFWVKAHRSGDYSASVRNGAKTRSYPFVVTVNAADTWEYKSVLIGGDTSGTWLTDTGVGLYLSIAIAAGSSRVGSANAWAGADYSGVTSTINGVAATSDTFQIAGVGALPLIAGVGVSDIPDAAHAPFLVRPFETELLYATRFWEKSYDYATALQSATYSGIANLGYATSAGANGTGAFSFKTRKRTNASSLSYWDGGGTVNLFSYRSAGAWTNAAGTGMATVIISETGAVVDTGSAGAVNAFAHYTANCRLP